MIKIKKIKNKKILIFKLYKIKIKASNSHLKIQKSWNLFVKLINKHKLRDKIE